MTKSAAEKKVEERAAVMEEAMEELRLKVVDIFDLDFQSLDDFLNALKRAKEQATRILAGSPLDGLDVPFKDEDLEWRVLSMFEYNGKPGAVIAPYVTNRAIMQRLDDVVGKENWFNEYTTTPVGGGVLCGITIKTENGEYVTKWDGADPTKKEATKGGLSDSMKRAAVQWGIGRHLYALPTAFAKVNPQGEHKAGGKIKVWSEEKKTMVDKNINFRWDHPTMAEVYATDARRKERRAGQ